MANINDYFNDDNITRGLQKINEINNSLSYDRELLKQYIPSSAVDENSIDIDLSSDRTNNIYNTESEESNENKSVVGKVFDFVKGPMLDVNIPTLNAALYGQIGDRVLGGIGRLAGTVAGVVDQDSSNIRDAWNRIKHASPADVWRMTFEKVYQVILSSDEKKLYDSNEKLKQAEISKEYVNQLEEVSKLNNELNKLVELGYLQQSVNNISNKLSQSIDKLDKLESYIKDNWKDSDVFYDLFVDKNKELSFKDSLLSLLYEIAPDKNIKFLSDEERKNNSALYNFLDDNLTGIQKILSSTGNVASTALNELLNIFGQGENSVRRSIRNLPDGNKYFDFLFDSYKSSTGGIKDGINNRIRDLRNKTDIMIEDLGREVREKQADVIHTHNVYKNGNFLFDPRKISKEYREEQEKERGLLSIFDITQLPYNLPEIGTSFADAADFAGLMAINTAGSVSSDVIARSAIAASPVGRGLKLATGAATVGGGLYFTREMRRNESNAEVTDAWSSRLLEQINNSNIDLNDILRQGEQFLNKRGIDTSRDNNLEKLQLMLAFDVPTTNQEFNRLKSQTRKGLAKVFNDNNTLSTLDYLQALPFMNYSGSVLRKTLSSTIGKNSMAPAANASKQLILDGAQKTAISMSDRLIQKMSNMMSDDLSSKLQIYHASKYLKDKIKKIIPVMASEGVEEGQQTLLQERYKRGEYDDYDAPESMFYIPSIFSDVRLASDAVSSYLGINFGDPDNGSDELRHAMNVGAITAMFFPMSHAVTNLFNTNEDNVRNILSQMKNDKIIRKIVGENYGKAQDDDHIGIFFDAINKLGRSSSKLEQSLQDLKLFKGDLVEDSFIDDDIKLLRTTQNVYNNPVMNQEILPALGIKVGDYNHKSITQRGVRNIIDANNAKDSKIKTDSELQSLYDSIINHLSDQQSEKTASQLHMLEQINKKYDEYLNANKKKFVHDQKEAIEAAARKNLVDEEVKMMESGTKEAEDVYDAKFKKEVERILNDSKEIEAVNSQLGNNLQSRDSFMRQYLENMLIAKNLKNAIKLREMLKNQESRQSLIRRETGTDINTERISGIINVLDAYIKNIKKTFDSQFEAKNKIIDEINSVLDSKTGGKIKKLKHLNVKNYFEDTGEFDNASDIDNLQQISFLNNAIYDILNAKSNAYITGRTNPNFISTAIRLPNWSELSQDQRNNYIERTRQRYQDEGKSDKFKGEKTARALYNNEMQVKRSALKKLKDKYNTLNDKIKNTDRQDLSLSDLMDLNQIEKDTAVELIRFDLDDKLNRKNIAHTERKLEKPITTDEIEASQNGDKQADDTISRKIQNFQELEQEQTEEPVNADEEIQQDDVEESKVISLIDHNPTDDYLLDDIIGNNEKSGSDSHDRISTMLDESNEEYEKQKRIAKDSQKDDPNKESTNIVEKRSEQVEGTLENESDVYTSDDITANNIIEDSTKDYDDNASNEDVIKEVINKLDSLNIFENYDKYTDEPLIINFVVTENGIDKNYGIQLHITVNIDEDGNKVVNGLISHQVEESISYNIGFHIPKKYELEDTDLNKSELLFDAFQFTVVDNNIPNQVVIKLPHTDQNLVIHLSGIYKEDQTPIDENSLVSDNIDNSTGLDKQSYDTTEDIDDYVQEDNVEYVESNNNLEQFPEDYIPATLNLEQFGEDSGGNLTIDGKHVDNLQLEQIEEEQNILEVLDNDLNVDVIDFVETNRFVSRRNIADTESAMTNYIEQTFFYQPDAEDPMMLTVGKTKLTIKDGNEYVLKVGSRKLKVRSGKQLSKKLVQRKWFENCNKFYIVSQTNTNTDKINPDGFTITLAIEDTATGEVYLSSLRTPSNYEYINKKGETVKVDGEANIKQFLRMVGVDMGQYKDALNTSVEYYYKLHNKKQSTNINKALQWYYRLPKDNPIKERIEYDARVNARKSNSSNMFTESQIDEQIQKLKEVRNEIIDAYCSKDENGNYIIPTEVIDSVKPSDFDISNGKIDNVIDESEMHVFRNLSGKDAKLGIADDIEDIEKQLQSSEIQFGFGTGSAWYVDPSDRNVIRNVVDGGSVLNFEGKGVAGKIYLIVTSPNGSQVPIILSEKKFKDQVDKNGNIKFLHRKRDNLKLCIDAVSGNINADSTPSAAEMLLYLITGRINVDMLPNSNKVLADVLSHMFINHGEKTLLSGDRVQNVFKYYADKQIAIQEDRKGNRVLVLGKTNEAGKKYQKQYSMEDLFGENSEEVRKDVIYTISENMHWNTDVNDMREKLDPNLLYSLEEYFTRNPKATEFKLGGIDLFTFKKDDLFVTDKDGNIIRHKNVSMLSWMIKTGKLMTDVSEDVFKAPFIYARGVQKTPSQRTVDEIKSNQIKPKIDVSPSVVETQAVKQISYEDYINSMMNKVSALEVKLNKKDFVARTEQRKKDILSVFDETQSKNGGLADIVAIDLGTEKIRTKEKLQEVIDNAVKKYIDYANKTRDDEHKLKYEDINMSQIPNATQIKMNTVAKGMITPIMYVTNNGTGSIVILSSTSDVKSRLSGVTGVFSKEKGKGKLNTDRARQWLNKTLGLSESQVIITNGLIRASQNELAYGVLNLSLDTLDKVRDGIITLSTQGGRGLHYHEAWHYVNLLLHNKYQRLNIYKDYVSKHPELKTAKFSEIEEAIAEDFRKYMEVQDGTGLTNKIKKLFTNILDFINKSRNKDILRTVFKRIKNGDYSNLKLDRDSVIEFEKRFPDGVPQTEFYIPGTRGSDISKFKGITDYSTFYKCGRSLANKLLNDYSLSTPDDIRSINRSLFEEFIEELKQQNEFESDPVIKLMVEDIVNNPQAFKQIINGIFKQYGLEPRFKKFKQLDETTEKTNLENIEDDSNARDIGDRSDFVFDIESIKISKKDNVAFRAKLFLSMIERSMFVTTMREENGQIVYDKSFEYVKDEILNTPEFVPYSECWNKILEDLWSCETYDQKIDGEYARSSLRGMVKRLKQSDSFYEALDRKLDAIQGDIELQNQIFGTVKSSKPQVAFQELRSPKKLSGLGELSNLDSDISEFYSNNRAIADRDREWIMRDDNTLRAKRNLPRNWSKTAVSSGLIEFVDGKMVVSKQYSDILQSMVEHGPNSIAAIIKSTDIKLKRITNPNEVNSILEDVNEQLYNNIISVLNFMAIPIDEPTFDYYIQSHLKQSQSMSNPTHKYNALKKIMDKGSKNPGTIRWFIQNIKRNVGRQELKLQGRKDTKPVDQIYQGFKENSEISKLAETYNKIHPSSSEFSVVGPDGSTMYPISQNNHTSDTIRKLNNSDGKYAQELMRSPYAKNSILLKYAKNLYGDVASEDLIKLDAFVGLRDSSTRNGNDYFGITPMEDYLAKLQMTFNNRIIFPTMADKKTWYALKIGSNSDYNFLPHDLITYDSNAENGSYKQMRFSDNTLNIFAGYFLDELNSLDQYYSRDNLSYLVKNKNELRDNFHGNIKDGRMLFGGNGGKFRYFYDIRQNGINLNQLLEFEYNRQRDIENGTILCKNGVGWMRENSNEFDGYELVRKQLNSIRRRYFTIDGSPKQALYDDLNSKLIENTMLELESLCKPGSLRMCSKTKNGTIIPYAIPSYILDFYAKQLKENGYNTSGRVYRSDINSDANALLSVIANHVASSAISIIEIEKVLTGDPAYYSWKNIKNKEYSTTEMTLKVSFGGNRLQEYTTRVSNLMQKDVDKTKRLGAILSPGQNLRVQYEDDVLSKYPELKGDRYTNLNISDINAKSLFLNEMINAFERQGLIDHIRNKKPEWFDDYITSHEDLFKNSFENAINIIYTNSKIYTEVLDLLRKHEEFVYEDIKNNAKDQARPYSDINVADAQVFIRPALYRKIKISLGQWTFEEDSTGYSDETAYNILEKDGSWLNDPEKYKLVQKFQLNALKMTYFANNPYEISYTSGGSANYQNIPVYNKMAIFPLFKFNSQSESGRMLYERMNMPGNELDMISFESSVKVGGTKYKYSPFEESTEQISKLSEKLKLKSDHYLSTDEKDYGEVRKANSNGEELLAVQIQDLDGLRMQLNTEEHETHERAIGTQLFKLAFSNIIDDTEYGLNKYTDKGRRQSRKGYEIKHDIMSCINAIVLQGVDNIVDRFYNTSNGVQRINKDAVRKLVTTIIQNNGIGAYAEEILQKGGTVSSLMSRTVFEQSVFSAVSKEIVDINTAGGSAIQQSIFGFVGYGKKQVSTQDEENNYYTFNNGEELKWNTKEGSMEVLLSANFFKEVVPKEYQQTPLMMRQWLIDNDVIKGTKTDGTKSNPKPFGLGYRIPTQGMSSIFSMIVADILPEQSSDSIVVPREFTAQTGSDFDVDKIFIATMYYTDGKLNTLENEDELSKLNTDGEKIKWYRSQNHRAVRNRLLYNYIDVVTDIKNIANARASIDTITSRIQNELLPELKPVQKEYAKGMYELAPYFQAIRKMEFSTGKSGIGPFALNVTNLALTQYTHLCMDYGNNEFDFGNLDKIQGQDGYRISDWLSAMVNAHVDVAKDPYIFTINVNRATYNHVNFLLRAGKGLSTFTFIAQPILKQYADQLNNAGGLYGQNIDGRTAISNVYDGKKQRIINQLRNDINKEIDYLLRTSGETMSKKDLVEWKIKINNLRNSKNDVLWDSVFDINDGIKAYQEYNSQNRTLSSAYFQLLALESFVRISKFSDELSDLVKCSRIDNKKFGKTIAEHINYKNTYDLFKFGNHKVHWYIRGDGETIMQRKDIKGEKNALEIYFNQLFLDNMFYNSIRYTREILNTQTYTATPIFESLFKSIMNDIRGSELYLQDGTQKVAYTPTSDNNLIKSIADAIDNIIRYRMLAHEGFTQYNAMIKNKNNDYVPYSGPIDFTIGGNPDAVVKNMQRLLFGIESNDSYETKPLFENVAKFIHYIQQNPDSELAEGLVENGKITNELLEYLNPQPASDNFPIGRLLLKKSQMNLGFDQKIILMSAFDSLLRHPNSVVRRLARDIAFYAYYSTYDTNTVNSFFDLVPFYYRKQYDASLQYGLKQSGNKLEQMLNYMNDAADQYSAIQYDLHDQVFDLISRNYWYNDEIVPRFYEHNKSSEKYNNFENGLCRAKINRKRFNGCIITTYANSPFFKIVDGDTVILYKKIGGIERTALVKDKKTGKKRSYKNANIYIAVHKLGLHQGSTHQYEFVSGSLHESMFIDENRLPEIFKYENIFKQIEDLYSKMNEDNSNMQFELVIDTNVDAITASDEMYYHTNNTVLKADYNADNSIKFITNKSGDNFASSNSNIILDINSDKHSDNSKTISIQDNMSVEDIVKLLTDNSKDGTNSIYISGDIVNIKPTQSEINQFVNVCVDEYKQRLQNENTLTESEIEDNLEIYKKQNKDKFEQQATQNKINQFIYDILDEYLTINKGKIELNTIYTYGDNQLAIAVANAAMLLQNDLNFKQGYVILDPKYSNPNRSKELLEVESKFDDVDRNVVLSNSEQQDENTIQEIVNQSNQLDADLDKVDDVENIKMDVDMDLENAIDMSDLMGQIGEDITKEVKKPSDINKPKNKQKDINEDFDDVSSVEDIASLLC